MRVVINIVDTGDIERIEISGEATGLQLREVVEARTGIRVADQVIIIGDHGSSLWNDATLSSQEIRHEELLTLNKRRQVIDVILDTPAGRKTIANLSRRATVAELYTAIKGVYPEFDERAERCVSFEGRLIDKFDDAMRNLEDLGIEDGSNVVAI